MATDVRQKYSLFSIGTTTPASFTQQTAVESIDSSAELDRAVALYSFPILSILRRDGQVRAQDLLRGLEGAVGQAQLPSYEEFLGLLNRLEKLNLIQIVERDQYGNHLIRAV